MANKNERKPTRTDIPSPERQAAFTRLMCRFIIADDDDLVAERSSAGAGRVAGSSWQLSRPQRYNEATTNR